MLICKPSRKKSCGNTAFNRTFRLRSSSNWRNCGLIHQQSLPGVSVRDLRERLWSSIDNDTSRDLDQIEVAEKLPNGDVKVLIGIADVDASVPKLSAIDQHAARETTSVYTGIRNFPMLPEELSTGKTSLLENQDRLSVVTEFVVGGDGHVTSSDVYRAVVSNKAQLQYNSLGAWLEGTAAAPPKVAASADLQTQLRLQDETAQKLRKQRYDNGALNLDTDETSAMVLDSQVVDVVRQQKNHATELIEDFMIAANGVVARMLEKVSSLRRIVKQAGALGPHRATGGEPRRKASGDTGFQGAERSSY